MDVETSVREFLRDEGVLAPGTDAVAADESLLDSGLLDSAGIFQLVAFLEDRFQLAILDDDIVPENFESISTIVGFVNAKVGTRGAGDSGSE